MESNLKTSGGPQGSQDEPAARPREEYRALAAFIREHLDEVAGNAFVAYNLEYPHSKATDLPRDASERWTKWVVLDIVDQIESGKPDPYWFQRNNGGDMVLQCDASFRPLAIAVEMLFFYGRVVAPMIWHHYLGDVKTIAALNDALEQFIQSAVRANMETFMEDLDKHGALQKTWRFVLDDPSGAWEDGESSKDLPPMPSERDGFSRIRESEKDPLIALTEREVQIAQYVAAGKTNKAIATELGIHLGTVKNHLSSIYEKLGVESRTELAVMLSAGSK